MGFRLIHGFKNDLAFELTICIAQGLTYTNT